MRFSTVSMSKQITLNAFKPAMCCFGQCVRECIFKNFPYIFTGVVRMDTKGINHASSYNRVLSLKRSFLSLSPSSMLLLLGCCYDVGMSFQNVIILLCIQSFRCSSYFFLSLSGSASKEAKWRGKNKTNKTHWEKYCATTQTDNKTVFKRRYILCVKEKRKNKISKQTNERVKDCQFITMHKICNTHRGNKIVRVGSVYHHQFRKNK